MAIRTNTNPRQMDLQPEFRQLLMRNGMQAHVVSNGTAYQLIVQGHDSPMLTYNISQKQMLALTDWEPILPTRKPIIYSQASLAMIFICQKTSYTSEMPMDV